MASVAGLPAGCRRERIKVPVPDSRLAAPPGQAPRDLRSAECADHLLVGREAAGCLLGEIEPAIDADLDHTAATLAQGNMGGRQFGEDQLPGL